MDGPSSLRQHSFNHLPGNIRERVIAAGVAISELLIGICFFTGGLDGIDPWGLPQEKSSSDAVCQTVSEDFAATREEFRWRHLVGE